MQERWATVVPCTDLFGRPRHATITLTDADEVAFVAPPGGAALFQPGDVNKLQQALTSAQVEAVDRRGGVR
jgi:hypothetical protein